MCIALGSVAVGQEKPQLPPVISPSGGAGGLITNPNTDSIKDIVLTSGAYLPGRIPLVFETQAKFTNKSDVTTRYVIPDGMVFLTTEQPTKYQFVVVLEGIRVNLKPGQSLTVDDGKFWTMCIERSTAVPPLNMNLTAAGVLPSSIVDVMNNYKYMKTDEQALTREKVIGLINDAILKHLGVTR